MRQYLANFFGVIGDGLKNGFKNRKWYLLGWFATWLVPLIMIATYMGLEASKKPKITFQPWMILVLVVLIIIYYKKVRGTVKKKFLAAEIKSVPINPLWYLLNGAVSVLAIGACYWVIQLLNQFNLDNLLTYLLICMASVGFGAFCYSIDAMNALIRRRVSLKGATA